MEIRIKYPVKLDLSGDKYKAYSMALSELFERYGDLPPDEYDIWNADIMDRLKI